MQETPFTARLTSLFSVVGETWSLTQNAWGMYHVYLYYKARWLPLGTADMLSMFLPNELSMRIAQAKDSFDQFGIPYPYYETKRSPSCTPPEITPRNPWTGLDTLLGTPHLIEPQQSPLARLSVPQAVLQQILQLPDGYDIKHLAIEDGALCVYCLTPETANLSPKDVVGQPAMTADYQLEDRNGYNWRRLESVQVDIVRSSTPKEQT